MAYCFQIITSSSSSSGLVTAGLVTAGLNIHPRWLLPVFAGDECCSSSWLTLLFVPNTAVLQLPAGAPGLPLQSELKGKTEDVVTQLGAVGAVGSSLLLFTFPPLLESEDVCAPPSSCSRWFDLLLPCWCDGSSCEIRRCNYQPCSSRRSYLRGDELLSCTNQVYTTGRATSETCSNKLQACWLPSFTR